MSIEVVGDGFFIDASQFNFLIADNKIIGFQKKRYDDDGHEKESCSVEGGILAILDLQNEEESQWEMLEFPAFDETPNSIDTYFTFQSKVYSLITKYTGGSQIQKLYEFKNINGEFVEISLDTPEEIEHSDDTITQVIIADGLFKDVRTYTNKLLIILSTGSTYRIFSLSIGNDNSGHVEYIATIEENSERGSALNAVVINNLLFINFEVDNHWDSSRILKFDLESHKNNIIEINSPEGLPPFSQNGAHSTWLWSPMPLWGFTTGINLKDSSFNGESWAIEGLLNASPFWHRRDYTVPEEYGGYVLTDSIYLDTYIIGKRQTVVVHNV
ncbi:unnamed protein product [Caenorhabditis angaria]|uniref:Uncharacterized protein n=1 Tax=Caenorhabditis angaria TaxID=860376 RepID=A0A9P1IS89_9PELO|nr:unnamed protein product [Caenorhabditis angaria]